MSNRKIITTSTTDVLEDVFNIEPGTTMSEIVVVEPTQMVRPPVYDDKDVEVDTQFQEVYDKALSAFEYQMERADSTDIDPKYVARMHEVAANYLNTALAAAKEKAAIKSNKDKINAVMKKAAANVTTNNTVIMTHADAIRALRERKKEESGDIIEGEFGD